MKKEGPQNSTWDTFFLSNHDQTILDGPNFIEVHLEPAQFFIWPGCTNFVVLLDLMILMGY